MKKLADLKKFKMKKALFWLIFLFPAWGMADEYDQIRFVDQVYLNSIRTVQLVQQGKPFSTPIYTLNSPEVLALSFDDLNGGFEAYNYTLIHCNADWTPSNLFQNQYLEGLFDDQIITNTPSVNTIQKYTHYELMLPNANMQLKQSGNYLLLVYRNFDKSQPVLTRRFFVLSTTFSVIPYLRRASKPSEIFTSHELDFDINTQNVRVFNPFEEVKVIIRQNGRWDKEVAGLTPLFVRENMLSYDFADRNIFKAGNEFRKVDLRSLRFRGDGMATLEVSNKGNFVEMRIDESRSDRRYLFYEDINGRFLIQNMEGRDARNDGDYITVKFKLAYPNGPIENGKVFIMGYFGDWKANEDTEMFYNFDTGQYEKELYLKQGFYDYKYGFQRNGSRFIDDDYFEGSHEETENDYEIFVYHRPPTSAQFDRLVAYTKVNSLNRLGR